MNAKDYQIHTFTMTSHDAMRIERKHNDKETISWYGAAEFEKAQMFRVAGHAEIILELAANYEIDNVEHIGTMEYIVPSEFTDEELELIDGEDEVNPTLHTLETLQGDRTDPMATCEHMGDNIKIHIYINDKYTFTTFKYPSKKDALKEIRSTLNDKELKVRAVLSNPGSDRRALKSLQG
jgi:hypothetical protein